MLLTVGFLGASPQTPRVGFAELWVYGFLLQIRKMLLREEVL
jgi:hypothetical protein